MNTPHRVSRVTSPCSHRAGLVCGPTPGPGQSPACGRAMPRPDLTVLAIPAFVGAMAAELLWQRRNPAPAGTTRAGDYELADTIASLTMGVGSLVAPFVSARLLDPVTPGRGRYAKVLMGTRRRGLGGHHRRRRRAAPPRAGRAPRRRHPPGHRPARAPHRPGCRAAPARCPARPAGHRCHRGRRRRVHRPDRRDDVVGADQRHPAVRGHPARPRHRPGRQRGRDPRLGLHLLLEPPVHAREPLHVGDPRRAPLERALQPVDGAAPAGGRRPDVRALRPARRCSACGPSVIENARALNLLYQYWIHTDTIQSIGRLEKVLNTPSHHRVHHGSNRQYLDRNHGSILIVWDRLFGTFEREDEPVVYGLTKNIDTFNPVTIATHEYATCSRRRRRDHLARALVVRAARARAGPTTAGPRSSARPTRRMPSPPDAAAARAGAVSLVSSTTIRVSLRHTADSLTVRAAPVDPTHCGGAPRADHRQRLRGHRRRQRHRSRGRRWPCSPAAAGSPPST